MSYLKLPPPATVLAPDICRGILEDFASLDAETVLVDLDSLGVDIATAEAGLAASIDGARGLQIGTVRLLRVEGDLVLEKTHNPIFF